MSHKAEVLLIYPTTEDLPVVAFIKQKDDDSIYKPMKHKELRLRSPSLQFTGEENGDIIVGDPKTEQGAVWYEYDRKATDNATSGEQKEHFRILSCDPNNMTAEILFVPPNEIGKNCRVKGVAVTTLAHLRAEIAAQHESLIAEAEELRRKEKADADAAFASRARSEWPIGVSKRMRIVSDSVKGFEQVTQRGDEKLFLSRQTDGKSSGGAVYNLQYSAGHTTLVDLMDDHPFLDKRRTFQLLDKENVSGVEGWHNVHIYPSDETIAGDYFYTVDLIGVSYALQSDSQYPIISEVYYFSPASKAGVVKGYQVLKIDGHSTRGLSLAELYDLTNAARPIVELETYHFMGLFGLGDGVVDKIRVQRQPKVEHVHVESKVEIQESTIESKVPLGSSVGIGLKLPANQSRDATLVTTIRTTGPLPKAIVDDRDRETNLRETPSARGSRKPIKNGEIIDVLDERSDGWLRVKTRFGDEGFVSAKNVKARDETAHAEVVLFVKRHHERASALEVDEMLRDYADSVDFLKEGNVKKGTMELDEHAYFSETSTLRENIESAVNVEQISYGYYVASYRLSVSRVKKVGPQPKPVTVDITLIIHLTHSAPQIVSHKQVVVTSGYGN